MSRPWNPGRRKLRHDRREQGPPRGPTARTGSRIRTRSIFRVASARVASAAAGVGGAGGGFAGVLAACWLLAGSLLARPGRNTEKKPLDHSGGLGRRLSGFPPSQASVPSRREPNRPRRPSRGPPAQSGPAARPGYDDPLPPSASSALRGAPCDEFRNGGDGVHVANGSRQGVNRSSSQARAKGGWQPRRERTKDARDGFRRDIMYRWSLAILWIYRPMKREVEKASFLSCSFLEGPICLFPPPVHNPRTTSRLTTRSTTSYGTVQTRVSKGNQPTNRRPPPSHPPLSPSAPFPPILPFLCAFCPTYAFWPGRRWELRIAPPASRNERRTDSTAGDEGRRRREMASEPLVRDTKPSFEERTPTVAATAARVNSLASHQLARPPSPQTQTQTQTQSFERLR